MFWLFPSVPPPLFLAGIEVIMAFAFSTSNTCNPKKISLSERSSHFFFSMPSDFLSIASSLHMFMVTFSVFIAQHVYIQYTFRTSHPHTFELSAFTKHSVLAEERHLNLDGVFRATLISRDYKVFLQTPLHRIQRQNQVSMDQGTKGMIYDIFWKENKNSL